MRHNQARDSQPRGQAEGVGFSLVGMVGIVCQFTGAVLEAAIGGQASAENVLICSRIEDPEGDHTAAD